MLVTQFPGNALGKTANTGPVLGFLATYVGDLEGILSSWVSLAQISCSENLGSGTVDKTLVSLSLESLVHSYLSVSLPTSLCTCMCVCVCVINLLVK